MGLLRTLTEWFKRREKPAAHPEAPVRPPRPAPRPAAPRPPAAAAAADLPPAVVPRRFSRVTVYYRQRGRQKELQPKLVLRGPIGAKLTLAMPAIEGFELFTITNFLDRFPASNTVIYLVYEPHIAAPVTIYHRDEEGRLLAEPTILVGRLNAPFTAQPLTRFKAQAAPLVQTGRFSKASQSRHFTYRLGALQQTAPEAEYVELLAPKPAFSSPMQLLKYDTLLPAGSFWRVFAVAKDQAGQVFLDLGGSQWIAADHAKPQRTNPFLPGPSQLRLTSDAVTFNAQPLQRVGQARAAVTRWAKPYGDALAPLPAGAKVALLRIVYGTDGSQWYRLADNSYVLASLIDVI
ncbi:MucBP domain-containing protein [Lacticaseibacillus jixianensis]|uniref:MucBP domain-containing protein n=1 Tax=Lacticaseibacillus jixianensis TaxID=2486012 RepID=A0ABW4BBC8_9LACO|nr:MucBP domain-containing protein [Lacticaseibacillus jixianensis]